jgi:hypothetical protein
MNCWLFVAAQRPNANGQFIHYASPRLRRDAKEDTKQLAQPFNSTSRSMNARLLFVTRPQVQRLYIYQKKANMSMLHSNNEFRSSAAQSVFKVSIFLQPLHPIHDCLRLYSGGCSVVCTDIRNPHFHEY